MGGGLGMFLGFSFLGVCKNSLDMLWNRFCTGKSFSEALILTSTNQQYDKRLFIELQVQYMKIASSEHGENMGRTWVEHVVYISCPECQKKQKKLV